MKNNKGFAISSIVYSMLILFLGLILLILGNLANRKAIFDKEKNDILSKFNESDEILCIAKTTVTNGNLAYGNYDYGDEYTCELGDNDSKTFYVLEKSEDNVSLILGTNFEGRGQWSSDGFNYKDDESQQAVALKAYLELQTAGWTKLEKNQIKLPTKDQIYIAAGNKSSNLPTWLYSRDDNVAVGYWTSTPDISSIDKAWYVSNGNLGSTHVSDSSNYGVRPVITISTSNIQN